MLIMASRSLALVASTKPTRAPPGQASWAPRASCEEYPPPRRSTEMTPEVRLDRQLFVYIPVIWVVPPGNGCWGPPQRPLLGGFGAGGPAGRRQATKLGARNGHIGERQQHPRQTAAGRARRDTAEPGGSREPEGSLPAVRRRTRVLVSGRESDRTYGSSRAQIAAAGRSARLYVIGSLLTGLARNSAELCKVKPSQNDERVLRALQDAGSPI
jgi:hypothetical protein